MAANPSSILEHLCELEREQFLVASALRSLADNAQSQGRSPLQAQALAMIASQAELVLIGLRQLRLTLAVPLKKEEER
jgi:hypothetical protein